MHNHAAKLGALVLANILLPVAVLVFASGFFPYKPVLPGLATFEDVQDDFSEKNDGPPKAIFDRVVFMVVDALRSDFVYGDKSGFDFTQSLIRSGAAIPFTAHATPPTVTMPRVKALTTGSVPSFLDLILNFAESDTSSSLATQDTWLAQLRAKGGKIVFYGDDTWLKLFPGDFFARSDGTSSFFVSDFTEVDHNVTRHVPDELERDDWNALILHYLGMDHIGHKTGPKGPNMLPKQREMDDRVRQIYDAMTTHSHHENTLLVLAGDHGMNAGGNHGGSGPGETEPALLFASPKFVNAQRRTRYDCPTEPQPGTEFHFYTKLQQSDVVPTLAGLMGFPVPKNSLGVFIRELGGQWVPADTLRLLRGNVRQMLHILRAKYGDAIFDNVSPGSMVGEAGVLAHEWVLAQTLSATAIARTGTDDAEVIAENALYGFLHHAQSALSDTASSYDVPKMAIGIAIAVLALICAFFSRHFSLTSTSLAFTSFLYMIMMFASSYVEEEQHFWYWLTPAWIIALGVQSLGQGLEKYGRSRVISAALVILTIHRGAERWNQTGQKHAGESDIVHHFFPNHHIIMWILICCTYIYVGVLLHNWAFADLFMPELAAFATVSIIVTAVVFKLNFTQADAPELVGNLARQIRAWTAPLDLVFQARSLFAMIAFTATAVTWLAVRRHRSNTKSGRNKRELSITLAARLHPLLMTFLMTQTRAPNVPLFLGFEIQRFALSRLLDAADKKSLDPEWRAQQRAMKVATTALLLSYVYYFCMGGSNSISSIDLGNAYNGVADYNIVAVGVLLFASNWAGPLWWCSATVLLMRPEVDSSSETHSTRQNGNRSWVAAERAKLRSDLTQPSERPSREPSPGQVDVWTTYVAHMTCFVATSLIGVMTACTALRTHLFIWTVFSPKYLYAMAWAIGWHLLVNVTLGSILHMCASVS